MKAIGLLLLFFLLSCAPVETSVPQLAFDHMGYDKPTLFVFKVVRSDAGHIVTGCDTIGLFCTDIEMKNGTGQKWSQWQQLTMDSGKYQLIADRADDAWQGISTSDSELFMHPARGNYRVLQFCPYLCFKKCTQPGNKWQWDFQVGGVWAVDSLYPIKDTPINIHTEYAFKDTVTVNSCFGNLLCDHIEAISSFVYGQSYGTFYLNDQYGLVYFKSKTTTGATYEFTLLNKIQGLDSLKFNPYYAFMYKKHNERNSFLRR